MIIIIYSVCPIFTNPPDWRKALSNGVRNHLFKLKTSKISQGGDLPPPAPPPRSRSGLRPDRRGLKLWEKKMIPRRGGGGRIEMHNIYPCLKCYISYEECVLDFWLRKYKRNNIFPLQNLSSDVFLQMKKKRFLYIKCENKFLPNVIDAQRANCCNGRTDHVICRESPLRAFNIYIHEKDVG